jgi:hypothetical protein
MRRTATALVAAALTFGSLSATAPEVQAVSYTRFTDCHFSKARWWGHRMDFNRQRPGGWCDVVLSKRLASVWGVSRSPVIERRYWGLG